MILEDYLSGTFKKYTNNAFYINCDYDNYNDYILAFSHFTYEFSGGNLMITDL